MPTSIPGSLPPITMTARSLCMASVNSGEFCILLAAIVKGSQCGEHEEGDCLLRCLSMTLQYLIVSCVPLVGYLPNISKYDT